MKQLLFTIAIFTIFSCRSIDRFQTSAYSRLAPQHQTIAILPIELVGQQLPHDLSEEVKEELLNYENSEIQNNIYSKILETTGRDKNDIKINIKSINSTNKILKENGIELNDIGDYSEGELASMLSVDAVLRTRVDSPIMLTSRDGDMPKEIVKVASIFTDVPLLDRARNLDVASVVIRSELIDMREGISIWAYEKKRDLKMLDKNTDLLRTLTKDICNNFPYREEQRRLTISN